MALFLQLIFAVCNEDETAIAVHKSTIPQQLGIDEDTIFEKASLFITDRLRSSVIHRTSSHGNVIQAISGTILSRHDRRELHRQYHSTI